MNKNAIQKYAVWARNELIGQVEQRAFQYGITAAGYGEANAVAIGGRVLSADEQKQRQDFIYRIKQSSFKQVVEEVAYTWFNRFVALRYMEVNDYLPSHIRVFTDTNGSFNPEILQKVLHLDLDGLDKAKVSELLNANKTEELYRYLLLTQCNALNSLLPEMFEPMGAYTEMLLPNNILRPDSIIGRLVTDIPEDNFQDAVQIIGWLYQYYNTEPKQAVFDGLKKNIKITKEKIPAATQLFTPDWIVRYMVENSLGRLWTESRPSSPLKANWKYYLDEPEQTPAVAEKLHILRSENAIKSPEDIKIIDPCMGSGHILVYAFDVLMQIYTSEGYSARDAVQLILEKNIYGLEIDRRAYQLAYFALMMKARQYSQRILRQGIKPQLYEPTGYAEGMEYGSLIQVDKPEPMPAEPQGELSVFDQNYTDKLNTWNFRRLLAQKYDVVVTNPPYMGSRGMGAAISDYLKEYYPETKSDTFSAFIERCGQMAKPNGFVGMFTPYVWMFIKSYERLRQNLYDTKNLTTLIQFEYSAFEEATVPVCTFVYRNKRTAEKGGYFRLVDFRGGMEVQRQKYLEAIEDPDCGFFYIATTDNFAKIPGSPVAYWASESVRMAFEQGVALSKIAVPRQGMATADNGRFVRNWCEVNLKKVSFTCGSSKKWYPYNNGGGFRKWYGHNTDIVNWENDGSEIKAFSKAYVRNEVDYFKTGITWNAITSSDVSVRYFPSGFI